MVRIISWLSLAALFLLISPKLREVVMDGIAWGVGGIVKYSPWSYLAALVGLLLFATMSNYRSPNRR